MKKYSEDPTSYQYSWIFAILGGILLYFFLPIAYPAIKATNKTTLLIGKKNALF